MTAGMPPHELALLPSACPSGWGYGELHEGDIDTLIELEQRCFSHAWTAADFRTAMAMDSSICRGGRLGGELVAFSIGCRDGAELRLASLAVGRGAVITVQVDGNDEALAREAIEQLISDNFYEE